MRTWSITQMLIKQVLKIAEKKLNKHKIKNPLFEAELLLCFVLKKEREFLLTYPDKKISKIALNKFNSLINKRVKNYPIAYLTGYKYFYGLKFFVNQDVLIPRPETEMMVEEAIKQITHNSQPVTLIDVGTGSGCVAITIAKEIINSPQFLISNFQFLIIDISPNALTVAKKNARQHNLSKQIKFFRGNLLEPIVKSKILNHKSKIIITANLPYLTPNQIKNSPSIQKEPRLALAAGTDGLKYYRTLFKQIKTIHQHLQATSYKLPTYQLHATNLILEIDHTQKSSITKLIKQEFPFAKFEIKKDLGGHFRLVNIII